MSAHISADVRALFADLGIEVENTDAAETGLVIDCFEQWGGHAGPAVRASTCVTNIDALRDVELAA